MVGSQAVLGTYADDELPEEATMSTEVDILPIDPDNARVIELAERIEGVAGEWSPFEEQHGFRIDGVDLTTAILPSGWRQRLVGVSNANTAAVSGRPRFTGWCLDVNDLCVAKLCAHRRKDLSFVAALLRAHLVERDVIAHRLVALTSAKVTAADRALHWLRAQPDVS